jgi:hypothetical protein
MTITLSKEELIEFQKNLTKWSVDRFHYALRNADEIRDLQNPLGTKKWNFDKALADFERENPMPSWRSLL